MKVFVVREEDHGLIFIAATLDAVKRKLVKENWVQSGCICWNDKKHDWDGLEDTYGENWQEAFYGFDEEDLENMGFYVRKMEVCE